MSSTQHAPKNLEKIPRLPILNQTDPLGRLWNDKTRIWDLALLKPTEFDGEGEKERHRIYSYALMKLVKEYWNGNKKGITGEYMDREEQVWQAASNGRKVYRPNKMDDPLTPVVRPRDYMGHNIAAIAVDGNGDIIDFEFNHNEVFCSQVEHAESRLVRRIFSLALLDEGWNLASSRPSNKPATNLGNVTIYTSLEPCAQCSGIMALSSVKRVVYLQRDFGTYVISNILFNLTQGTGIPSPRPIPANEFGFEFFDRLNNGFKKLSTQVTGETPFWKHPTDATRNETVPSVTSFLCTDTAYKIYEDASSAFDKLPLRYGDYPKNTAPPATDRESTSAQAVAQFQVKTNADVLKRAQIFVSEAVRIGRRGTPHQL
jgi:tRNA(Arg) A34 adenosine deaminase TadA